MGAPEEVVAEATPEEVATEAAPEEVVAEAVPEEVAAEAAPEEVVAEAVPEVVAEEPKESKLGSSRFESLNTVEDIIETPIEEIPKEMVKEAISNPETPEQKEIISKLIAEMDANTDKTTRCGTVSAERFKASTTAPVHEEPPEMKKEQKVGLWGYIKKNWFGMK